MEDMRDWLLMKEMALYYIFLAKCPPSFLMILFVHRVMQGWLFFNGATFWHKEQAQALLTSVPIVSRDRRRQGESKEGR